MILKILIFNNLFYIIIFLKISKKLDKLIMFNHSLNYFLRNIIKIELIVNVYDINLSKKKNNLINIKSIKDIFQKINCQI